MQFWGPCPLSVWGTDVFGRYLGCPLGAAQEVGLFSCPCCLCNAPQSQNSGEEQRAPHGSDRPELRCSTTARWASYSCRMNASERRNRAMAVALMNDPAQ